MKISELAQEILQGKGYVIIPDLLSQTEADNARTSILSLAKKARDQGQLNINDKKERLYGLIYQEKVFENLVQHPLILSLIESILGEDMVLGGFSAHILYPGAKRMGIHVDYPYWAMSSPYPTNPVLEVQVIWLLEDFTENNGAPIFAAGTQKLANELNHETFEEIGQKITGKAGSAIVSHGLCWHDTSVNETDRPRVSLLGNYTPQFIQPLENNLFDYQSEVMENASPKLRQLMRNQWQTEDKPVFELNYKL